MKLKAILLALFVTFLWSTSWVLIRFGLRENIPALTFAGLRYTLAFLCLVPFVLFQPAERRALLALSRREWLQLFWLGLFFYAFSQGLQFISLWLMPTVTVNLTLNLSPALVALMAAVWGRERATPLQWLGVLITTTGVLVFFLPFNSGGYTLAGVLALAGLLLANSVSSFLARDANFHTQIPTLTLTTVSMGIGALLMLGGGLALQGLGRVSMGSWLAIAWMAVVNTALAFTLWNRTLKTLTAVESTIICSAIMPQIALLTLFILREPISLRQGLGMFLVAAGVLVVQLRRD